MTRPTPVLVLLIGACAAALVAAGCGSQSPQDNRGAQLFSQRCGGCHSLDAAGTEGSTGVRPTGPNLNQRHETRDQVLFAIRNGGFSGAIMPQNIVVGGDADDVALFLAKYAGRQARSPKGPTPKTQPSAGSRTTATNSTDTPESQQPGTQ